MEVPAFLAKHVFACTADGHLVFLDLKNDRYFCLDRSKSEGVEPLLRANPRSCGEHLELGQSLHKSMQTLADKGILVYDSAEGKKLSFAGIDPALDSLISATKPTVDAISLRLTGRFWAAATYASACLRWGSIEQTVLSIQRKRLICGKESPPITSYRVSDLVNAFYVLRYFYPREYLCLFDSLALLRFLAQYRFFPQWVFGVKLTPFAAHCWVQDRTLILNDTVENVQKYTPIMAI